MEKKKKEVGIRPGSWLLLYTDGSQKQFPFRFSFYFLFRETKTNKLDSASQLPSPLHWRNLAEGPGEDASH